MLSTYASREDIESLWKAIGDLSPNEQDVLYLKYRRDLKIAQIAAIVGKSENAVKLCLSRARKKLSQHPNLQPISGFSDRYYEHMNARYKKDDTFS